LIRINSTNVRTYRLQTPYDAKYSFGSFSSLSDNQSNTDTYLKSEWEQWKREFITSNGAKGLKEMHLPNRDIVSEGLGYGMLLSIYFGEQQTFDDLYRYVKSYFNSNGLMGWHIDSNGNLDGTGDKDAATDADEDIAVLLEFAHKKWDSNGSLRI
jgi:endo-1,4-beta-D-glucanase Y